MTWVSPSGGRTTAPSPISSTHLRLCRTWVVLPGTAESKSRSCRPGTITDAHVTLAPDIVTLLARPGRWLQVTRTLRSELTTPESRPAATQSPGPPPPRVPARRARTHRLRLHPSRPGQPSRPRQDPGGPRVASTNFCRPPATHLAALNSEPERPWDDLGAYGTLGCGIRLGGFREPRPGFHGRHDEV
jgi:hypothetical protein